MSSSPKPYFCHECSCTVSICVSPSSDVVCPHCGGGFVEEHEIPSTGPNPSPAAPIHHLFSDPLSSSVGLAGFPLVLSTSSGGFDLHQFSDPSQRAAPASDPDAFNPILFLQNHLQNLTAGGANIQFVIENGSDTFGRGGGAAAFRLPANFGDYFLGPGLEQLIQHLAENDPNRHGTPPAAKAAVSALPDVNVTNELLASDSAQCAVCMDTFEFGALAKQMPCKHIFHRDCILPWLELHNSCPVCRFELPTDDPDYENRMRGAASPRPSYAADQTSANTTFVLGHGSSGQGEPGATTPPTGRRFRIPLPWPLRVFRSGTESSNGTSGNDNGGDRNQRSNDDPVPGPEAMQEDLD